MQLAAARKFVGTIPRPHAHLHFVRTRAQQVVSNPGDESSRGAVWRVSSAGEMSTNLQYPKPTVVPARGQHTASIVWLHGLGDTASGWSFLPGQLKDLDHVKFIFPTAPQRPISINYGMLMTGWFDIKSLEKLDQEDEGGLLESQRYVRELIQKEVDAGIPSSHVLVGGFSQGGAIALLSLRSEVKLAGVVGLSTYLPLHTKPPVASDLNKDIPVLICHGDVDHVIAYKYGKKSVDMLRAAGLSNLKFNTYPGLSHSACPEELAELQKFLQAVLPASLTM